MAIAISVPVGAFVLLSLGLVLLFAHHETRTPRHHRHRTRPNTHFEKRLPSSTTSPHSPNVSHGSHRLGNGNHSHTASEESQNTRRSPYPLPLKPDKVPIPGPLRTRYSPVPFLELEEQIPLRDSPVTTLRTRDSPIPFLERSENAPLQKRPANQGAQDLPIPFHKSEKRVSLHDHPARLRNSPISFNEKPFFEKRIEMKVPNTTPTESKSEEGRSEEGNLEDGDILPSQRYDPTTDPPIPPLTRTKSGLQHQLPPQPAAKPKKRGRSPTLTSRPQHPPQRPGTRLLSGSPFTTNATPSPSRSLLTWERIAVENARIRAQQLPSPGSPVSPLTQLPNIPGWLHKSEQSSSGMSGSISSGARSVSSGIEVGLHDPEFDPPPLSSPPATAAKTGRSDSSRDRGFNGPSSEWSSSSSGEGGGGGGVMLKRSSSTPLSRTSGERKIMGRVGGQGGEVGRSVSERVAGRESNRGRDVRRDGRGKVGWSIQE